ncbi:SGNH/GDSL hydrolase family protein [Paenibacillus koleovorans]|uniref:SGNH/GDSL hydrolase family protein n=1 Tax=Paenibacillus koleovorans TaxID=121608 RepID=UPI0013E37D38|nr:SGNH/GDSL hydrolase family protein [Paenibacillus koleovorans]
MIQLEKREWCEFWWEETGPSPKKRILLIGDSITKGYYPYVKERLQNEAVVDKLATSKAVGNPSLLRELDYMLRHPIGYRYDAVHFNNGLHGQHLSVEEYERGMEEVIRYVVEAGPPFIVLALCTPVTEVKAPDRLDAKVNAMVMERNQAVRQLAAQYALSLNDLYTPMLGRSEYGAGDGYHFNEQGRQAQAELTAQAIMAAIV